MYTHKAEKRRNAYEQDQVRGKLEQLIRYYAHRCAECGERFDGEGHYCPAHEDHRDRQQED